MRALGGAEATVVTGPMSSPSWLYDGDEVIARLRDAGVAVERAEPSYVREKAGESVVVGYRLTAGDDVVPGYVRWCADPDRAAVEWHKALALVPTDTPLGAGAVRVGDRAVLRILPNDAGLRRARWYLTPRKLKRSLAEIDHGGRVLSGSATSVTPLTYKPERRVVARLDLGYRDRSRSSAILRYTARPTAVRLAATAAHLAARGVATARSIATLESGRVSIDELLPGADLRSAAVACGGDPSRVTVLASAVADQVSALHRAGPPTVAPIRRRDDELAAASTALRWLDGRGEVDARLADAVWDRLTVAARTAPVAPVALLHGDLHDRNILVDTAADGAASASLIDLERVAVGDPAIDLGYLAAHGIAGAIRRTDGHLVRDVVARVVADVADQQGVADDSLRLHTALGLVEAALTAARHLEGSRSPDLVSRLLETALAQLPGLPHRT